MTLCLSDLVVGGEIFNTSWYSVHGWVGLRGREQAVHLQLTGNCADDLAGWHFRFAARNADDQSLPTPGELAALRGFAWQQVGPTGLMTCRAEEEAPREDPSRFSQESLARDADAGPRRLRLEWFGQNGRVVIELVDPKIEWVEYNDLQANPAGPPRMRADTDDELFDGDTAYLDAADASLAEGDAPLAGMPWGEDADDRSGLEEPSWLDDEEDPYALLPESLKEQFDEAAFQTDKALDLDHAPSDGPPWGTRDEEEKSEAVRQWERLDECVERGEGELLVDLFEGPLRLPRPDQLQSESEAERSLKALLARLARCGVSLAVCHHFTPRDAYRLLIEKICVEERAYRELQGTQWVQTFMTSEYCSQCDEEFEREYQEYERRRRERGEGDNDRHSF